MRFGWTFPEVTPLAPSIWNHEMAAELPTMNNEAIAQWIEQNVPAESLLAKKCY